MQQAYSYPVYQSFFAVRCSFLQEDLLMPAVLPVLSSCFVCLYERIIIVVQGRGERDIPQGGINPVAGKKRNYQAPVIAARITCASTRPAAEAKNAFAIFSCLKSDDFRHDKERPEDLLSMLVPVSE
jgi:hypothetical protein